MTLSAIEGAFLQHPYHFTAMMLFLIGFFTLLTHSNVIKKVIGLNIMETGVFLFFVASGYIRGGQAPIVRAGVETYVNPLPAALILTGIVIAISITAFSLALIVRLYERFETLDANKMAERIRGQSL